VMAVVEAGVMDSNLQGEAGRALRVDWRPSGFRDYIPVVGRFRPKVK
jgi:hypothetical protein